MAPLSAPGQSRPLGILDAMIVFTVFPPVFLGLRLWARKLKGTPLGLNDYLIIISAALQMVDLGNTLPD
ncbi:hypothetical protein BOTNAR_0209g00070 [Botryotinia narcissicola]|uniref:Uncharacterized protein n=1 Tax=Botryotinia narcissicola TaxID=278944 RepID=A0A4Z1I679_9HELO|nr:hypothetical protein BOTNAR_0209g00070 [Botryotinia narcissicola]